MARGAISMARYAFAIFLSAFLLFSVQPIIARFILPLYGGSPTVWTTCMLFFQVLLLGGYTYAHLIRSCLAPQRQVLVHLSLLALSLFFLPITPSEAWKTLDPNRPILGILALLTATVGAPYLLLSSASPLLQHWSSGTRPAASPYRLYALSNAGSLLGLLIYPFAVEPLLPLRSQTILWSAGYALSAAALAWCGVSVWRRRSALSPAATPPSPSSRSTKAMDRLLWLALTACGSIVLLAVTNYICQEVGVVPFLWILPLSLYLISFIVCFDHERWYNRRIFVPLLVASLAAAVFLLHYDPRGERTSLVLQISVFSATLFACCMICHGELVRLKPPARQLTSFYLMVALGGALGGAFVNLAAPHLFTDYWELHVGFAATAVLLGWCFLRDERCATWLLPRWVWRELWIGGTGTLVIFLAWHIHGYGRGATLTSRSFYGVLRLIESKDVSGGRRSSLWHGKICHGEQFLDDERRTWPTAYYGRESGIGLALAHYPRHRLKPEGESLPSSGPLRIGVVGLGAGTLATYGRHGDQMRFYEINPRVAELATSHFTFLADSAADVEIIAGDGRVSLERELRENGGHQLDVLVVDAFSSDAIPVHLITREAFALYWELLRPDGVLAVHISNRHIDLTPVIRGLTRDLGKRALLITDVGNAEVGVWNSDWVLVTGNLAILEHDEIRARSDPAFETDSRAITWTDDFSNVFRVLR